MPSRGSHHPSEICQAGVSEGSRSKERAGWFIEECPEGWWSLLRWAASFESGSYRARYGDGGELFDEPQRGSDMHRTPYDVAVDIKRPC
jgi:hypothetical protein